MSFNYSLSSNFRQLLFLFSIVFRTLVSNLHSTKKKARVLLEEITIGPASCFLNLAFVNGHSIITKII